VEVLAERNLLANTYLCFTSDYGEMMGDHHLFRKGFPYEGPARVPLILASPAGSGLPRNRVCDPVIELRDIMPTLFECAGLPVPETVEGRSFLPIAMGQASAAHPWREVLHGEHTLGVGPGAGQQSIHWLTDGHRKYVWFSSTGDEQLFDLDSDPQELHDLARQPAQADNLSRWRQALTRELAGREEGFTDGRRLIPRRPVRPCLSFLACQ